MLYVFLGYLFLHVIGLPEMAMADDITIGFTLMMAGISIVMSAIVVSGYWLGSRLSKRRFRSNYTLLAIGFAVAVIKITIVRSGAFDYAYLSAADAIAFWIFFMLGWLPLARKVRP
ncbi:MAG: hypothetical protein JJU03_11590 [Idiomarina sp.]|nr:hypothetical protein [Idiomarina sp.]